MRAHVLDDQGALPEHVILLVGGQPRLDRREIAQPGSDSASLLDIVQALSGARGDMLSWHPISSSRPAKASSTSAAAPPGRAIDHVPFPGHGVSASLPDPRDGTLDSALDLGHLGVELHGLPRIHGVGVIA